MGRAMPSEEDAFAALPDPGQARNLDELIERLRRLKVWAGDPSYETIKSRVNAAWSSAGRPAGELTYRPTVAKCFRPGRRRLNTDLVLAVVEALHPDTGYVMQWRQALRVIGGETEAVSQVRIRDSLPAELPGFTGRARELDQLRRAAPARGAAVVAAVEGMAGVGKTELAMHAARLLARENAADRVLLVNLLGFHPDPVQPPADPAAVLDGFLRLLGVPGHRIPHDLGARAALYRERLAGSRAVVVLDDAVHADQVRPLLPATPDSVTLVTGRRSLAGLRPAVRLTVEVFTPAESTAFLTAAVPGVPAGPDPDAAARIARRCGHLPLALSLIAGHIRNTPDWTLTDHADRLDERHRERRLDTGVELAFDLSYRCLPAARQRLLRLAALHPGPDVDARAAAVLTGTDLRATQAGLERLCADHLLQETMPGRYTMHDLVRAYATGRAHDQDRPAERRAALTRLFDHYLATAVAAVNLLHPAEANLQPTITPALTFTDPDRAREWLDDERPTLVAVARHTATYGWPHHTTWLARTLYFYLRGGFHTDALTVHSHAHRAARHRGDRDGQARALTALGFAHQRLGRYATAAEHFQQAIALYRQTGDLVGQACALGNIGFVLMQEGRYPEALASLREALILDRLTGDQAGEVKGLNTVGIIMERSRRFAEAVDCHRQALTLARKTRDQNGEAYALIGLGDIATASGRYRAAGGHLHQALALHRQLGNRSGEANALTSLGTLHTGLGEPDQATGWYQQALRIIRDSGDRNLESWALNGLGEAAFAAGRPADARTHHAAAHTIATAIGSRDQQARARAGLGRAHAGLGRAHHSPGGSSRPSEATG